MAAEESTGYGIADTAEKITDGVTLDVLARFGFAVLAVVHILIGVIALQVAFGGTGQAEPTGALPSLVYIWENASERAFHERTAAAILVLLTFMIIMNAAAIVLRRRFERRW